VTGDVKFGNSYAARIERLHVECWDERVLRETTWELLSPLTANVVGYNDVLDTSVDVICESGRDSVVNIAVPGGS
jgi:hypothetical protein